ncbi:hypothetical protein EV426DRAFT_707606 [Tirmania nivea]|nr:hypothetical protein EV426DRAFT_707606 [Tirmania nivea]
MRKAEKQVETEVEKMRGIEREREKRMELIIESVKPITQEQIERAVRQAVRDELRTMRIEWTKLIQETLRQHQRAPTPPGQQTTASAPGKASMLAVRPPPRMPTQKLEVQALFKGMDAIDTPEGNLGPTQILPSQDPGSYPSNGAMPTTKTIIAGKEEEQKKIEQKGQKKPARRFSISAVDFEGDTRASSEEGGRNWKRTVIGGPQKRWQAG